MKKGFSYLGLSLVTAILIGCGDGDLDTKDLKYEQKNIFDEVVLRDIDYKDYNVTAVDDPIIHAKVEAKECNSSIESNVTDGVYQLQGCVSKPTFISITDGIMITKDKDGKEINITQSFPLLLNTKQTNLDNGFVVSPLTTIVATAEDNSTIEKVAEKLGVDKEDLFKDPREVTGTETNASEVALKINNILIQAAENGSIVNKVEFIKTVQDEIKNSDKSGNDLNFSKVAENVNEKAQKNPDFFGFVMIPTKKIESKNILEELADTQHPNELHFAGFVFDEAFKADISVYEQDDSKIEVNASCDDNGYWSIEDKDNKLHKAIYDKNQTLTFKAVKSDDATIVLKSTISTPRLRELLNKQKRVTASKDNALIISNVTTAEHAILEKRGVFDKTGDEAIKAYDNNKTDIKTYYNDVLLKAAATIKAVVDGNEDVGDDEDTYKLVTQNLDDNGNDYKIPEEIDKKEVEKQKKKITKSPILKSQLYDVQTKSIAKTDKENKITLETVAKKANYTFYRLFAYDSKPGENDRDNLVRIYEKIVLAPGGSTYELYKVESDNTTWDKIEKKEFNISNFTNGNFAITKNSIQEEFSLEANNSIYVEKTNKTYNYYNIIKTLYKNSELDKRETILWVDDFDIVDAFRRLPEESKTDFDNLWDEVKGEDNNDTLNSKINKYVKDYINNVDDYFSNEK